MVEADYDPRLVDERHDRFVMISGCSGSGKSSLLEELAARGFDTCAEPGRQIVKEQQSIGGDALPWANATQFVALVISRAMHQMVTAARNAQRTFFDRGIVDAVTALERLDLPVPAHYRTALHRYRYNRKVFLSPPWPEIFCNDGERRHPFEEAAAECTALEAAYACHGYDIVLLPKLAVAARADFILAQLA